MKTFDVLLVEDEFISGFLIKKQLEANGFRVLGPVAKGNDAVAKACRYHPQYVLMDIGLAGDMNGIEASVQIKHTYNADIIFITGYINKSFEDQAMQQHPVAYLHKPVHVHQVIELLKNRQQ